MSDIRFKPGSVTFSLIGVRETVELFNLLNNRIQKRILGKAVRAGGSVYLKRARELAPANNKIFKRSLIMVIRRYLSGVWAIVGQDRSKVAGKAATKRASKLKGGGISGSNKTVPIHLVDQDIAPHAITPTDKKVLAFPIGGTTRFSLNVRHPGIRGKDFMRRAAASAGPAAVDTFEGKYRHELFSEVQLLIAGSMLMRGLR